MRIGCPYLSPFFHRLPALGTAFLAFVAAGCGREGATPSRLVSAYSAHDGIASARGGVAAVAPAGEFFPLTVGNRWHAVAEARIRLEPSGGGPPLEESILHEDITRVLIGTETVLGKSYTVQEETTVETGDPQALVAWIRYRQDGTGLYEADIDLHVPPTLDARTAPLGRRQFERGGRRPLPTALAARIPPPQEDAYRVAWDRLQSRIEGIRSLLRAGAAAQAGPPGGLLPGEITRLRYPLRPGAEWAIRSDPLFESRVEAAEALELPAGRFSSWRIGIGFEFLGSEDFVRVWVGRAGQLAFRYHLVSIATDVDGNEIGRFVFDRDEELQDLSLAGA